MGPGPQDPLAVTVQPSAEQSRLLLEESQDLLQQALGAGVTELFLDHFDQLVDLLVGKIDAELLFQCANRVFGKGTKQVLVGADAPDQCFRFGFELFNVQFFCHNKAFFLNM